MGPEVQADYQELIAELMGEIALAEAVQQEADGHIAAAKAMAFLSSSEVQGATNEVDADVVEKYQYLASPDYGIESVAPGRKLTISDVEMPWLNESTHEVSTVLLTSQSGKQFEFADATDGSTALKKLAGKVPSGEVKKVETGLFKALPTWLEGQPAANIHSVSTALGEGVLYKTGKVGKDPARLAFVRHDVDDSPIIVQVAMSRHKDQTQMLAPLTGTSNKVKRG